MIDREVRCVLGRALRETKGPLGIPKGPPPRLEGPRGSRRGGFAPRTTPSPSAGPKALGGRQAGRLAGRSAGRSVGRPVGRLASRPAESATKQPNMDCTGPIIYPDGDLSLNMNLRRSKSTRIDQKNIKFIVFSFLAMGPFFTGLGPQIIPSTIS